MNPLTYIVIINYKNYIDTIECVKSLERIYYDNYRIIIIDNNSSNDSEEKLRECFPQHIIIQAGANLGFAHGNNIGIKIAMKEGAEYILLLNNDTIVEPNFLNLLIECFKRNKNAGLVSGKIYDYNKKDEIDYSGGYIDYFKFTTVHNKVSNIYQYQDIDKDKEVGFISGCLMLIKAEVIKEIGILSEEYFMYYEDTDYCVRVEDSGYKLFYTPKAVIYHKISSSTGGRQSSFSIQWNNRNRLIFMYKYRYKVKKAIFMLSLIYYYITRYTRSFCYCLIGDKERANAVWRGLSEAKKIISQCKKSGDFYV